MKDGFLNIFKTILNWINKNKKNIKDNEINKTTFWTIQSEINNNIDYTSLPIISVGGAGGAGNPGAGGGANWDGGGGGGGTIVMSPFNVIDGSISLDQIYFQERVNNVFVFCIYKQDNVFKIGLFEITNSSNYTYNYILKTDNLTEIIETLENNLSNEEFQEYERRIFKYF